MKSGHLRQLILISDVITRIGGWAVIILAAGSFTNARIREVSLGAAIIMFDDSNEISRIKSALAKSVEERDAALAKLTTSNNEISNLKTQLADAREKLETQLEIDRQKNAEVRTITVPDKTTVIALKRAKRNLLAEKGRLSQCNLSIEDLSAKLAIAEASKRDAEKKAARIESDRMRESSTLPRYGSGATTDRAPKSFCLGIPFSTR